MAPAGSVTILHLSSLRFGRGPLSAQDGVSSLLSRLTGDLDEQAVREGLRPDLVVMSGDFTEHGKREEFEQAASFVRGLRAHLGLGARRFVLVPGNHDINWNKSRAYFEDREGDGLLPELPFFPKFVHYKRFFDEFYEGEVGLSFTEDEPWTIYEYPDLGVVVAGLDSVVAESHRDEDHHAFLGERQLRAVAAKLRPWKERGYLRIGVMHHDPFDRRGGARGAQDQHDLRRFLVPELNLVLHSRGARDVQVRASAAMATGDLESLNEIARTADPTLRGKIGIGLELYGEIRSLLQVGKLRRARVRFDGRDVGVLEELNRVGNGTRFKYLAEYDGPPIAPNMPLGPPYESEDGLVPFFANLLPEGALYEQTARRLGVKRSDRFGVLLRVGADTMGAVEVVPMEPA